MPTNAVIKLLVCTISTLMITFSANASFYEDLAFHHAPIHYQDTDSTYYPGDYITAIDYDSDWTSNNNWDNLNGGQWPATAYYSVVESCSHYFITYAFFHPRDWDDKAFKDEHENDLEGALFIVRKTNSMYGKLDGMITVAHADFYSYTAQDSSLSNGNEDIDGDITFTYYEGADRARTAQEAKGHGLKAWPHIANFTGENNQDGIIYYPTRGAGEYPSSGNDRHVKYELVSMFEPNGLWVQALNEATNPGQTFHSWGTFRGNTSGGCGRGWKNCSSNSANTPWGWDDNDDGDSYRGEFAKDPAALVDFYFNGLGNFSREYVSNAFLQDLRSLGFSNKHTPVGFADQLHLNDMYATLDAYCM